MGPYRRGRCAGDDGPARDSPGTGTPCTMVRRRVAVGKAGAERVRIELLDRPLFIRKTVAVFASSFVLLPLLEFRSEVPALLYAAALVVLHVIVLIVYLFRVPMRELASSWRGVAVRVLALAVVLYLLVLLSRFDENASQATLAVQLFFVAVLHAVVLLLISARLARESESPSTAAASAEPRVPGPR